MAPPACQDTLRPRDKAASGQAIGMHPATVTPHNGRDGRDHTPPAADWGGKATVVAPIHAPNRIRPTDPGTPHGRTPRGDTAGEWSCQDR